MSIRAFILELSDTISVSPLLQGHGLSQGRVTLYYPNHINFCMGRKFVFVLGICGLLKN